LSLKAIP